MKVSENKGYAIDFRIIITPITVNDSLVLIFFNFNINNVLKVNEKNMLNIYSSEDLILFKS